MSERKMCVLDETKSCVECGQCQLCDLDPGKICDNCMKCLHKENSDYAEIQIDAIYEEESAPDEDE